MKAKKYLGQHFLHNQEISERIGKAALDLPVNQFIEIGPGKGALTQFLVNDQGKKILAIETDRDLIPYLKIHFANIPVIQANFLKLNISEFNIEFPAAIVGNFPYNISSQIVFKAIENYERIPFLLGMFQKEMAERICASPGNKSYGVISVMAQAIYDCDILFYVDRTNFSPPPKVQSAVIRLSRKKTIDPEVLSKEFRQIVKVAFGQRRKMLRNSLKPFFALNFLDQPFFKQRPERLSVDDFAYLARQLKKLKMSLEEKINGALKVAMKEKDKATLRALRAIKSEILLFKTSGENKDLTEDGEIKILQKMVKQRTDSLEIYQKENRGDLAEKENEEIAVIQTFLPEQLSKEDLEKIIENIIDQTGAQGMKDMGKVMGKAKSEIGGRADGKSIADTVKSLLQR